jgi:hypothetical protein
MLQGLYKVKFRSGGDEGSCVCLFREGHIAGGGAVMYYLGSYEVTDGNHFVAEMEAKRHTQKKTSPIMGLDEFHMTMEGIYSGAYAQVVGRIVEVPEAVLLANLVRLSEI